MYQYRYVRMGRKMIFLATRDIRLNIPQHRWHMSKISESSIVEPVRFSVGSGLLVQKWHPNFSSHICLHPKQAPSTGDIIFYFLRLLFEVCSESQLFWIFLGWSHSCLQIPLRLHLKKAAPQHCIPPAKGSFVGGLLRNLSISCLQLLSER